MTETAADGRHRAAGDHVHGARRSLLRRRPSAHFGRGQADRSARRMPLQSRGAAGARPAPRGQSSRLRDDAARTDRRHAEAERPRRHRRRSRPISGATCSRTSAPRIISTASPMPTRSSTSRPTGRIRRSALDHGRHRQDAGAAGSLGRHRGDRSRRIRSGSRPARRAASSTPPSTRRRRRRRARARPP